MKRADKIVVLGLGRVLEQGTHEELMGHRASEGGRPLQGPPQAELAAEAEAAGAWGGPGTVGGSGGNGVVSGVDGSGGSGGKGGAYSGGGALTYRDLVALQLR